VDKHNAKIQHASSNFVTLKNFMMMTITGTLFHLLCCDVMQL